MVTVPYDFVGGTRAIADQVDANFAALVNAFNDSVPIVLTAPTTFYVSPTGADILGNGLASTSPAATITYILNLLRTEYNLAGQNVTIQLANGTYTETVIHNGAIPGLQAGAGLIIQGNLAAPNLVTWNSGAGACLGCANGSLIAVQGITMQSTTSQCIISNLHSRVLIPAGGNMIFGSVFQTHMLAARGGVIEARGNYSITGGGRDHARAIEGGEIYIDPAPGNFTDYGAVIGSPIVTISGTPNFTTAFATCRNAGIMRILAAFTGTGATGVRSTTATNGVININGQGPTYLPGNAPGTDSTGGITA